MANLAIYFFSGRMSCGINVQRSFQKCKIIFDEAPSADVLRLDFEGEFDVVPDVSDAASKFENMSLLFLVGVKIKLVERCKLTPFKRQLKTLYLSKNEITQLDSDTLDDSINLSNLHLDDNNLIKLDSDLFRELVNLEMLYLNKNQLETIPRGLFRNNKKLEFLHLESNKINNIEFDFQVSDLPKLFRVVLSNNVCINQECLLPFGCRDAMNENIRKNCRN